MSDRICCRPACRVEASVQVDGEDFCAMHAPTPTRPEGRERSAIPSLAGAARLVIRDGVSGKTCYTCGTLPHVTGCPIAALIAAMAAHEAAEDERLIGAVHPTPAEERREAVAELMHQVQELYDNPAVAALRHLHPHIFAKSDAALARLRELGP